MERHFALPIAFAAALHAALLFGFDTSPRSRPPVEKKVAGSTTVWTQVEVVADPPTATDTVVPTPSAKAPVEPPPIRSPELPATLAATDFHLSIPSFRAQGVDSAAVTLDYPGRTEGSGTESGGFDVLGALELDSPPRARFQSAPIFPHEARRDGLQGEVVVEFVVDEEGRVLDPRVLHSSHGIFDAPTLRAVAKWRFQPGRSAGQIVRFRIVVPVLFTVAE